MSNSDEYVSFTRAEVEVLKLIVADWLNEEIAVAPFDDKTEAVLKKLGFAAPKGAEVASMPQDVASERAVIRTGKPSSD
jgi:hypothetical protein